MGEAMQAQDIKCDYPSLPHSDLAGLICFILLLKGRLFPPWHWTEKDSHHRLKHVILSRADINSFSPRNYNQSKEGDSMLTNIM